MKTRKLLFTKSLKAIFFLAVWCVCSLTAQAQSGDFGEGNALHWTFNSGTLTISGTGDMEDEAYPTPWDNYKNSITTVDIGSGVTRIGFAAFANCENLASVTIPSTVTTIGVDAFRNTGFTTFTVPATVTTIEGNPLPLCSGLSAVNVDGGSTSYKSEDGVLLDYAGTTLITYPAGKTTTDYTIPSGVADIYYLAFYDAKFTSVTIPASVTNIQDLAFAQCLNLTSYTVESSNTTYSSTDGVLFDLTEATLIAYPPNKAGSSYTVPGTVTRIGVGAFSYSSLTSVAFPSTLTSIGGEAFSSCNELSSVTLPASLNSIEGVAFSYCAGLSSVTILATTPPSLGLNVFISVPSSCTLTVPVGSESAYNTWGSYFSSINGNSTTQTWNCGPSGSSSVTATLAGGTLTVSGAGPMDNYDFANPAPWDSYKNDITAVIIEDNVTGIGNCAFVYTGLTSVTIPAGVTSIGENVFGWSHNLTGITVETENPSYSSGNGVLFNKDKTTLITCPIGKTGAYIIPNSVTDIAIGAFISCENLTSVTIPGSVTFIGDWAFDDCTALAFVTSLAATPPVLGTDAFAGIPADANLHISAVFASAYLSSAWGSYFSLFAVQPSYLQTGNPASSLTAGANTGYYFLRVDSIGGHTGINSGMPHVFGEGVVLFAGKDASGRSALFIDTLSQAAKRHPAYLATSNDAEIYASASWKVAVTSDVGGGNHTFDFTNERQQRLLSVNASEAGQEARIPGDDLGGWHFSDGISSLQTCRPLYTYTSPDRVIVLVADPVNPLGTVKVKDVAVTDLYSISGINGLLYFTLVERSLSISADLLYFAAGGGSRSLNIVSNGQWIVTGASGGALPSWITVSPSSGTGNRTLGIAATANPATSSRTAVIEIYDGCTDCGTGAPLLGTVTVTQDAATSTPAPALSVSPASLDFAAAGGALSIAVSSGTSWTVSSSASWATLSAASGSGNGSVTVTASAHSGTTSRTATVTVSGGGLTRTVDVTQAEAPAPPSLEVATASLHFETAGGTQNVAVTANRDWTASGDASWLTVTKSGVTLGVTAAPNTGYARTGSVTVTAGGITQTVTVAQDAAQQIIAEPAPPEDGHGAIEIALEIPVTEQFRITFTVTLPAGFVLDQQATSLVSELLNSYRLSITPNGQGGWLFEITPATSLRSDDGTAYRQIVNIAYTVPDNVKNGSYEVKLQKMTLTMNSGEVVMRDEISVPVRVGGIAGSADIETAEILYRNGILSVATPVSEQIAVYSTGGVPVYLARKAEGIATFDLNGLPKGVYIVRGSSGWVRKIAF
jgi:hypothetical protein